MVYYKNESPSVILRVLAARKKLSSPGDNMTKWHLILIMMAILPGPAGDAAAHDPAFRTADGKIITFEQMIDEVKGRDVVLVGELHDNADHHRVQLAVIDALTRSGRKTTVGLEMFRADSQKDLDSWVAGRTPEERFKPVYYKNWQAPWGLYRDIFLYARSARVPLLGLNVPSQVTRKVAKEGFASLGRNEMNKLPPGISCNVDRAYMEFIRRAYSAHGSNEKEFLHFCEAQMVWDSAMAWNIIGYLKKNPGRTVVALTGSGHAWKRGIPEQIKRHAKLSYAVILPEIPGRSDRDSMTPGDADYIMLYH